VSWSVFGTNCDRLPETMPIKSLPSPLNLLWVGSGWVRKGGEMALSILDILRAGGRDARLTLVGDVPADIAPRPGLEVAGYLDKRRRREARRLEELYREAHLLILPTQADCTPMVLAEAGAHGTPVLVTNTGGVGSLVSDGINGRLLAPGSVPMDWVKAVRGMTDDPAAHAALCRSSFRHARARLTWDAWAARMVTLLRAEVVLARQPAAA
jgi:glycosyltransferase involved in cell wall biosynthesis